MEPERVRVDAGFSEIAAAALEVRARSALLDGELAILLPDGRTSFQALQNSLKGERRGELVYFVFDLLELDGRDLWRAPLDERKRLLERVVPRHGPIRFSQHWTGGGGAVFREACRLGFEGIVSKRRDQPHDAGRSPGWLKTKCVLRQEFVVGGFTEPSGSRKGIGALLFGAYEDGRLRFTGKVGTGFTQETSQALRERLDRLRIDDCPFSPPPPGWMGRKGRWVKPELLAEVVFTEWTEGGHVRHPSFRGLREDKPPRQVKRERTEVRGIALSHAGRVVFPAQRYTKLDLARYHDLVADREVPHLRGRPLTLLRCPGAITCGSPSRRSSAST